MNLYPSQELSQKFHPVTSICISLAGTVPFSTLCARKGWEVTGLTATLNDVRVELLRRKERRGLGQTNYSIGHKQQGSSFLSLDSNYSMKINMYCIGCKWEIITFLIRTTRSFHSRVFPLLALQISYSWYLLWPSLIHSFMKLSQAPEESHKLFISAMFIFEKVTVLSVSIPRSPHSPFGPLVAWACYFPLNSEMRCTQLKIHNVFFHKFQQFPVEEVWTFSDSWLFLSSFLTLPSTFGIQQVCGD